MLLAIETATSICSVALLNGNQTLSEQSALTKQRHNETLPVILAQLLKQTGTTYQQITQVAVSIGPGSFTGLRVGLSFAKGLSLSIGATLIPVATLDALALQLYRIYLSESNVLDKLLICPLTVARKGEAFGRLFSYKNELIPESELFFGDGEIVLDQVGDRAVIFGGEGAEMLSDQLEDCNLISNVYASAITVGHIALKQCHLNSGIEYVDSIEPMYIKEFTIKTKRKL